MVEKRERRENCQSIMVDEERLGPHGVGYLPHVVTRKSKSSTFGVEELSAFITDVFNEVPVFLWLNFKLKREQEIEVESTSRVADCILEELPN